MNTQMISFHGQKSIQTKYLNRVSAHREADQLIQGETGYDGKGCAVWCTLDAYDHSRYPIELGIPEWLARLEDHIFEALDVEESRKWPEQFLNAIPIGIPESKFNIIRDEFQIFWLERQKTQIDSAKYAQVALAIDGVIALLNLAISGSEPESAAWSAAESAARSAARSAGYSEAIVKRDWLLSELAKLTP